MNSFFNWRPRLLLILGLFFSSNLMALTLSGFYTGTCDRQLGLLLNVTSTNVYFLSLNGAVSSIPRYQIVQWVSYPVDSLTGTFQIESLKVPLFRVYSRLDSNEVLFLSGFPLNFTSDKISFLTTLGQEVVVDKFSISRIEMISDESSFDIVSRGGRNFNFVHPYAFRECAQPTEGESVYPTQILSEPLTIKRELDRFMGGFLRVRQYIDEQDFYPHPLTYSNKTSLGLWQNFGSRYGSSGGRSNNATPYLVSEKASDIYSFQRVIITGSGPNELFEHEESQTQALYAFKASYFHFVMMMDPSLVMVGKTYRWTKEDLDDVDTRIVQTGIFELGFDRGPFALGLGSSSIEYGVRQGSYFFQDTLTNRRLHFQWTGFNDRIQVMTGSGVKNDRLGAVDVEYSSLRINWSHRLSNDMNGSLSAIKRSLSYGSETDAGLDEQTSFSGVLNWNVRKAYRLGGLVGYEHQKLVSRKAADHVSGKDQGFLKLGLSFHLYF